jgi:hypothetical protein
LLLIQPAGGLHYLYRFCAEQTVTVNTTAAPELRSGFELSKKAAGRWHPLRIAAGTPKRSAPVTGPIRSEHH